MSLFPATVSHPEHDLGRPRPGLQVFCLAHAGGSAAHFQAWRGLVPGARIIPLELPGRGARMSEPQVQDWPALADSLTDTIATELGPVLGDPRDPGVPYVLFGHSLGALLAFDVSHRLIARGRPPALLAVAGRNGPSVPSCHRPVHRLSDQEFADAMHALGGLPAVLFQQPELMRMFLPIIRADLRLAELYVRPPVPPLPIPVVAFAGRQDPMTDAAGMLTWVTETTGVCELVFLEGGHFFLRSQEFERQLAGRLARPIDGALV